MNRIFTTAVLAASLCISASISHAGSDWKELDTRRDLLEKVDGRVLQDKKGNTLSIYRDGTFKATFNDKSITGDWKFDKGYVCRKAKDGTDDKLGCQLWQVNGDQVRITPDKNRPERARVFAILAD